MNRQYVTPLLDPPLKASPLMLMAECGSNGIPCPDVGVLRLHSASAHLRHCPEHFAHHLLGKRHATESKPKRSPCMSTLRPNQMARVHQPYDSLQPQGRGGCNVSSPMSSVKQEICLRFLSILGYWQYCSTLGLLLPGVWYRPGVVVECDGG